MGFFHNSLFDRFLGKKTEKQAKQKTLRSYGSKDNLFQRIQKRNQMVSDIEKEMDR